MQGWARLHKGTEKKFTAVTLLQVGDWDFIIKRPCWLVPADGVGSVNRPCGWCRQTVVVLADLVSVDGTVGVRGGGPPRVTGAGVRLCPSGREASRFQPSGLLVLTSGTTGRTGTNGKNASMETGPHDKLNSRLEKELT